MSTDPRIGNELAGYRLEALLGRGGMGVVYRARDLALDRDVALKLLAPELAGDVSFRERFLRESRLAAALEHPNVVPIHDAGEIDGQLYIAMRLVEGTDLKKALREGPLEPVRAVRVLEQVAGALDAAHARGLVHRDVKPSNVLLDERGHVYLADFGLSRYLGDAALPLGPAKSLGTADYVAPEQIRGEQVDGRADVYAVGCMLYECLAGAPPFRRGSDAATLYAQLEEEPPVLPGLEEVLPKALAKKPAGRYPTCGELIDEAREGLGIAEPKRSRWPIAVAVVGVALDRRRPRRLLPQPRRRERRVTGPGWTPPPDRPRLEPRHGLRPRRRRPGRRLRGKRARLGCVVPRQHALAARREVGEPDQDRRGRSALRPDDLRRKRVRRGRGAGPVHGQHLQVRRLDRRPGRRHRRPRLQSRERGVRRLGRRLPRRPAAEHRGADPRFRANVPIPFAEPLSAENYREALPAMAQGEGAVWVIGDAADRRLWRIDPQQHRIAATIALSFPPGGVAAGGGAVWVTDELGDRVVRIDPATHRVVGAIPVGHGAIGVAVGAGSVWVADATGHSLTRIDPANNRVTATIRVPASPRAVAVGEGSVWAVGDGR